MLFNERHGGFPVIGFGNYIYVIRLLEELTNTGPHNRVVIG
jgi:hypothetical protein